MKRNISYGVIPPVPAPMKPSSDLDLHEGQIRQFYACCTFPQMHISQHMHPDIILQKMEVGAILITFLIPSGPTALHKENKRNRSASFRWRELDMAVNCLFQILLDMLFSFILAFSPNVKFILSFPSVFFYTFRSFLTIFLHHFVA